MNAQTLFEWISDAIKYAGIREYKYFRQISGMKVEYSAGEKENTIYRLTIGDTVIYEKWVLAIIGVTAGMLSGLFGVGALLAAYVSRVTENDESFKANISAVFIVDNTFRIIFYKTLGLLTQETVKTVILLIPFALSGPFTGMKCCGHMNDKKVRKITTVLLILSGISLVLKNL